MRPFLNYKLDSMRSIISRYEIKINIKVRNKRITNLVIRICTIWHGNCSTLNRFNNFNELPSFGFIRYIIQTFLPLCASTDRINSILQQTMNRFNANTTKLFKILEDNLIKLATFNYGYHITSLH